MTDTELRKLKRVELLKLMIEQDKEMESLRVQLDQAMKQLQQREIHLDEAGSIAEAALRLNGVFEAAQQSARQYLDNIEQRSEQQDEICARRERESQAQAQQLLEETMARCADMENETKAICHAMVANATAEAGTQCAAVSQELESLNTPRRDLEKLFSADGAENGVKKNA